MHVNALSVLQRRAEAAMEPFEATLRTVCAADSGTGYRRVPNFSPHGSLYCACAQRFGLPRVSLVRAR